MTVRLTIGSLFSGYGGLDLAAEQVLDAETVWTCDVDPAASRILRHRFPGAPNLGDIAGVDWPVVRRLPGGPTGGFPCQDVSHAGARKGLGPGTRTGLWARMADAIDHLRPQLVIAENVRGLLSAPADSDVEPCPWCLGGASDGEPALRALGSVLADLADLGYDAAWHGLRAADVGAPHGRFRVFILAWPADTHGSGLEGRVVQGTGADEWPGQDRSRRAATERGRADGAVADAGCGSVQRRADPRGVAGTPRTGEGEGIQRERRRDTPSDAGADAADAAAAGRRREGRDTGIPGRPAPEWPTESRRRDGAASADAGRCGRDGRAPDEVGRPVGRTPVARDRAAATPDADGDGLALVGRVDPVARDLDGRGRPHVAWADYEPAIRRWERTLGRPAPAPTEPATRGGGQRLSPRFVEWLMGLPDGWVTDIPGLTRNDQLKALGNGVVPQQAAAALRILLAWRAVPAGSDALFDLEGA